jgi:GMP synthase (glutamine-hydrolysing)
MKLKRLHYFQHASFEGPDNILKWAAEKDLMVTHTKFFLNEPLPLVDEIDYLLIMGGPMGVYDTDKFSWLESEIEFIQSFIKTNKKTLGICLGAQLIAASLGAKVYPNTHKEIGWFDIESNSSFLNWPKKLEVFHWHGDTFDLPASAKNIYSSKLCKNQLFTYNNNVMGLQFHVEVSKNGIEGMMKNLSSEVPDENKIREGYKQLPTLEPYLNAVLDWFIS